MSRKLTREEVSKRISQVHNGEFELIGEYINNSTKVEILHKKCGNIINKSPCKMMGDKPDYCYICSGKNKHKTTESFRKEVFTKYGEEYKILGEYVGARMKLLVRHSCGHEYEVSPDNLLRGRGCPKCSMVKTHEQYSKEIEEKYKGKYSVVDRYKGCYVEIHFHCKEHNLNFKKQPYLMLKGSVCPLCAQRTQWDSALFKEKLYEMYGNEYELLDVYKNNREEMLVRHICGHEYKATRGNLLRGFHRCPRCCKSISKYVETVKRFLSTYGIVYEMERRFDDCFYKSKLPFDFYLPNENICIEVDGEFHYIATRFTNGEKGLQLTQKRDKIKNDYCKNNGIKLIRLPYYEWHNFDDILKRELQVNTEVTTRDNTLMAP